MKKTPIKLSMVAAIAIDRCNKRRLIKQKALKELKNGSNKKV